MDPDRDNILRRVEQWSHEMDQFMNHILSARHQPLPFGPAVWQPAVNVYETEDALLVYAELAGVNAEDVAVRFEPGRLIVAGERQEPVPSGCCGVHQMEITTGPFAFVVSVPFEADSDNVEASYHDGWLEIRLPKAAPKTAVTLTIHPRSADKPTTGA